MKSILKTYNSWKKEIRLLEIELEEEYGLSKRGDTIVGGKCSARRHYSVVESNAEFMIGKANRLAELKKLVKKVDVILDNDKCNVLKLKYIDNLSVETISIRYHVGRSTVYKMINIALDTIEPYRAYFYHVDDEFQKCV